MFGCIDVSGFLSYCRLRQIKRKIIRSRPVLIVFFEVWLFYQLDLPYPNLLLSRHNLHGKSSPDQIQFKFIAHWEITNFRLIFFKDLGTSAEAT